MTQAQAQSIDFGFRIVATVNPDGTWRIERNGARIGTYAVLDDAKSYIRSLFVAENKTDWEHA